MIEVVSINVRMADPVVCPGRSPNLVGVRMARFGKSWAALLVVVMLVKMPVRERVAEELGRPQPSYVWNAFAYGTSLALLILMLVVVERRWFGHWPSR
jgi:hypothetical protein